MTMSCSDRIGQVLRRLKNKNRPSRWLFFAIGLLSLIWFLVRVIPKPSRANYPCMKVAYPFMSGFVAYLLGLLISVAAFRRAWHHFSRTKYLAALLFIMIAAIVYFVSFSQESRPVYANSKSLLPANQPVGIARGLFPGRVVWIWDPHSTNESCTNKFGDGWFMDKNTDQSVVDVMLADAIKQLSGRSTIPEAWNAFFTYFNSRKAKGAVGYRDGEKLFIRINQVSASNSTIEADYAVKNTSRYGMAETSPQVMLSLLRQLVNECGIKQELISIGDPMKHMYKHVYDRLHAEFPRATYLDFYGTWGRTKPVAGPSPSIQYSDRGTVLKSNGSTGTPILDDIFPTVITEADYIIALPAMKAHARAGVTLCGKLHFGSNLRGSATHLHGGLVSPEMTPTRTGYGLYRVQVDLMGHKDLGEKTVLFVLDALWAGSEANDPPRKFRMSPFNNDWTSSILVSQDQVALESVGFDFLKAEFTTSNPFGSYPQIIGTDDHILQAADSTFWPAGLVYDPENDGRSIPSLGVCEHWNNADEKLYSRNLHNGNGIELIQVDRSTTSVKELIVRTPAAFELGPNYPNPFNPSTSIPFQLLRSGYVTLIIYDMSGRQVMDCIHEFKATGCYEYNWTVNQMSHLASGPFFARLRVDGYTKTIKMLLVR
jgi:hypothetical protein